MQTISFRRWLEDLEDPFGIKDPEAMAQHWRDNMPMEDPKHNEQAIWDFVNHMSEPWISGVLLADHLSGEKFTEVLYPDKPIAKNFLDIDDPRLGMVRGVVTNEDSPSFRFAMGGRLAGNLYIDVLPMIYEQTDKTLLASIVYHELGHARDFLADKPYDIPSGRLTFNAEAYAHNLNEARRYSDQLRWLLKTLGSVDVVMKALEGKRTIGQDIAQKYHALGAEPPVLSPFRMPAALLPVAKAFLERFHQNLSEGWLHKLAGPLVAAASVFSGSGAAPAVIDRPVLVANQQQEQVKQCAEMVRHIIGLMLFRNFVKRG
jgi:hypothetical protein